MKASNREGIKVIIVYNWGGVKRKPAPGRMCVVVVEEEEEEEEGK